MNSSEGVRVVADVGGIITPIDGDGLLVPGRSYDPDDRTDDGEDVEGNRGTPPGWAALLGMDAHH